MTSQPETELEEEGMSDDAVLDLLAKKREPAEEGAEVEEEEAEEPEEEGEEPETEEPGDDDPEIDLGDLKAKKSQILAWKAGEMKDADYRRKTTEAAEAKREALELKQRVEQERGHYANQLDVLIHQLHAELIGSQQEMAELAAIDPGEWVRRNAIQQQKIQRFQSAMQERQAIEQRTRSDAERTQAEKTRGEVEKLRAAIPEWRDGQVMQKDLNDVETFIRNHGFSDEDMAMFVDSRVFLMARRAMQAESRASALASAKGKKTSSPPPKAVKAGAASQQQKVGQDEYQSALKRARSGKEDDLLALLAAKRKRN